VRNAQVIIAELGTDMSVFPTAGHAAAWARLTPRTLQSGNTTRPGRTGKGDPCLRGALGQCVMAAARTDTRIGEQYRRTARRRGKQKGIVAVSRVIWRSPGCSSAAAAHGSLTSAPTTTASAALRVRPVPGSARSNGSTPA
jgi:transposase